MATVATRQEKKHCSIKPEKNRLDSDRPSNGRRLHALIRKAGILSEMGIFRQLTSVKRAIPDENL
jgi:hypothetical protein